MAPHRLSYLRQRCSRRWSVHWASKCSALFLTIPLHALRSSELDWKSTGLMLKNWETEDEKLWDVSGGSATRIHANSIMRLILMRKDCGECEEYLQFLVIRAMVKEAVAWPKGREFGTDVQKTWLEVFRKGIGSVPQRSIKNLAKLAPSKAQWARQTNR